MSNNTRREFLKRGMGAAGLLVCGGCAPAIRKEQPPAAPAADGLPSVPVALQRCESYEPRLVRERVGRALDLIGGVGDLVRGKTVTVKLNLTGRIEEACGRKAHRTYHVHPVVVGALCAALADAGARRIVLAEGFYSHHPVEEFLTEGGWDLAMIGSAGAHKVMFENTRNRGVFLSYSRLKVPGGGLLFPAFDVNARYEKTDVFISLAKLKENTATRVTLAAKNMIGILPMSLYGNEAPDEDSTQARTGIVHDGFMDVPDGVPGERKDIKAPDCDRELQYRIPWTIVDLVKARPIDLALIDGVETISGGEGPWSWDIEAVEPKLILAGRNPACTDAVGTAVMGYDPNTPHMKKPFDGLNMVRLMAETGVGTNDIGRIDVRGLTVKQALFPFGGRGG